MNHPYIFTALCVIVIALGLHIEERWAMRASQKKE